MEVLETLPHAYCEIHRVHFKRFIDHDGIFIGCLICGKDKCNKISENPEPPRRPAKTSRKPVKLISRFLKNEKSS